MSKTGAPKIYIKDLRSNNLKQVTFGWTIDTEPFWSPDGKSIFFTSNRGGQPQIYRLNIATGKVKRVTFKGRYNATPSLTPDGEHLIMMHKTDSGNFNIAKLSLDDGRLTTLTDARLNDSPSLAPNGMMVIYGINEGSNSTLGAVSLDGKFKMRLPVMNGNVKEPAWSPFLS